MTDHLSLPKDKELASKIIENQSRARELSFGLCGKLFGNNKYTSAYVAAALVALIVIAMFIFSMAADEKKLANGLELLKNLSPILTTLVGFICGAASSTKTDG